MAEEEQGDRTFILAGKKIQLPYFARGGGFLVRGSGFLQMARRKGQ